MEDLLLPQSDLSFSRAALLLLLFSVAWEDLVLAGGGVPAGLPPSRRPFAGADAGRVYLVGPTAVMGAGFWACFACCCFFSFWEQLWVSGLRCFWQKTLPQSSQVKGRKSRSLQRLQWSPTCRRPSDGGVDGLIVCALDIMRNWISLWFFLVVL